MPRDPEDLVVITGQPLSFTWNLRPCLRRKKPKLEDAKVWTVDSFARRWDREFDPFLFESIGIMEGISMCEKFIHS